MVPREPDGARRRLMELGGAFQISVGFGAGNIGDEFMGRAFWDTLPPALHLEVALFPEHARQHEAYPAQHRYVAVDWNGNENAHVECGAGLLVGGTPVAEVEGLHFPLQFLARRLNHFHERGLPVYAAGAGVDLLESPEGLELFRGSFSGIHSWTVRAEHCRRALVAMGVPAERVITGADWAWLYRPRGDRRMWAADLLSGLGIDVERPLLIANIVNMVWQGAVEARRAIAAAFDRLVAGHDFQICFFAQECRDGEYFDFAAAGQIRDLMKRPAALIPNLYYSPDEALGLLSHATLTVGQRYHFAVATVLSGVAPVCLVRGQKMRGLADELDLPVAGSVDRANEEEILQCLRQTLERRADLVSRLAEARSLLRARAARNLEFLRRDFPEIGGSRR